MEIREKYKQDIMRYRKAKYIHMLSIMRVMFSKNIDFVEDPDFYSLYKVCYELENKLHRFYFMNWR